MEILKETRQMGQADMFISVLDETTMQSAKCYAEMLLAKDAGKPMYYIVPLDMKLPLPKEYTEGVKHYRIRATRFPKVVMEHDDIMAILKHLQPDIEAFFRFLEEQEAKNNG